VVSQTPKGTSPTSGYLQGWESLTRMIVEQNLSWSGRERNLVYLNLRDGTFADVSTISGADAIGDGRALGAVDWDDDGRVDLFLRNRTAPRLQFYRNQSEGDAHFLAVDLVGTTSNRDAIGSRVTVEVDGRTLTRTLHAGEGFLAQSSKRLHFGLDDDARVERLTVRWPDGTLSEFTDVAGDARYRVTQGSDELAVVPRLGSSLARVAPRPAQRDRGIPRLELMEKLPLAPVGVPSFADPERTVADLAGGTTLLNLWSTTCAACLEEFGTFRDRKRDLEDSGLEVITLATDGLAERKKAKELLERYGLADGAGYVDDALLAVLELVFQQVVGSQQQTPLPTSLLLDGAGQLVAIYFGPVVVDELLADVRSVARLAPENLTDVRLGPGSWLFKTERPYTVFIRNLRDIGRDDLAKFYRRLSKDRQ